MNSWTKQDFIQFVTLTKHIPQPIPGEVFNAVNSRFVLPSVDVVNICQIKSEYYVWLTRRPMNDKFWPNQEHTPGTVLRKTDPSLEAACQRCATDELGVNITELHECGSVYTQNTNRGPSVSIVHLCFFNEKPRYGKYYPISKLPDNFIEHQRPIVELALKQFKFQRDKLKLNM